MKITWEYVRRRWQNLRIGYSYISFFYGLLMLVLVALTYLNIKTVFSLVVLSGSVILVSIPVLVYIGDWHMKKQQPTDAALMAKKNPYNRDLAKALICLAEGKDREAARIMKRWL